MTLEQNLDDIGLSDKQIEYVLLHLNNYIDYKLLAYKQQLKEKLEKEKVSLDDTYTDEEKELLTVIGHPDHKTPEYLRERRHGFNQAIGTAINIINEEV